MQSHKKVQLGQKLIRSPKTTHEALFLTSSDIRYQECCLLVDTDTIVGAKGLLPSVGQQADQPTLTATLTEKKTGDNNVSKKADSMWGFHKTIKMNKSRQQYNYTCLNS